MGVCKVIYKDNTLVDLTQDTVSAGDLRQGVTAHDSKGDLVTGAMQEQGTLNEEISTVNQVVEIPEGYHSGYGSVEIAGSEQAKIIPENIREGVNILGVTGSHEDGVDLSSDTVTADKLLTGTTAHNSQGQQISGSMADRSGTSGSIDIASGTFFIPQGYHDGTCTVAISQSEQAKIIPENIKSGVEILGVTGTASGDGGGTDTSGDTVTASDLLAGVTAHDASGEQITGTMPNRGQVTGSMSFVNDVFAIAQGYHDGTGSVQIDSAEQAKIIASNIKSGVSILGVTGNYEGEGGGGVDTSSDTVTAATMIAGTTAHDANGNLITGTMVNRGSFSSSITRKDQVVTIPQGYHDGTGTVQISAYEQSQIIAENIKDGEYILDVEGSCKHIDTSDDTVESWNLREGYTAHDFNGDLITGTLPYYSDWSEHVTDITTGYVDIPDGIIDGGAVYLNFENIEYFTPENIRAGLTIAGVTGSLVGLDYKEISKNRESFSNFRIDDTTSMVTQLVYDAEDNNAILDEYAVRATYLYCCRMSNYPSSVDWKMRPAVFSTVSTQDKTESISNCIRLSHSSNGAHWSYLFTNEIYFYAPVDGYIIIYRNNIGNASQYTTKCARVDVDYD